MDSISPSPSPSPSSSLSPSDTVVIRCHTSTVQYCPAVSTWLGSLFSSPPWWLSRSPPLRCPTNYESVSSPSTTRPSFFVRRPACLESSPPLCSPKTYCYVVIGSRGGRVKFWNSLPHTLALPGTLVTMPTGASSNRLEKDSKTLAMPSHPEYPSAVRAGWRRCQHIARTRQSIPKQFLELPKIARSALSSSNPPGAAQLAPQLAGMTL